jgi:hypothetical protein
MPATTPLTSNPELGMDPTVPSVATLPGGVTPAFGQRSLSEGEWRFDFHGLIIAPLAVGIGDRVMPQPGQSGTTLHTPPAVPDDLETFSHTGVVPTTYVQLNFSEGTSIVQANMSILARQANASTSFLEPATQLGVNDLFVSVLPKLEHWRTDVLIGAFASRYGSPGEYDEGRYGTPLIARVNGIGERISVRRAFGNWVLMAEEGLAGQSNKAGTDGHARRLERLREPERGDQLRRARSPGRARRTAARCWAALPATPGARTTAQQRAQRHADRRQPPDAKLDIVAATCG